MRIKGGGGTRLKLCIKATISNYVTCVEGAAGKFLGMHDYYVVVLQLQLQ